MKIFILLAFLLNFAIAGDKPNFKVVDTEGKIHSQKSTNGKFLIVNLWATWCPPCIKEIPEFVDFYEKDQDKVQILGFDYENISKEKSQNFTDGFMVNYPIILTKNQRQEFEKFSVKYLPTTYIYDKNGKLLQDFVGKMSMAQLEKILNFK